MPKFVAENIGLKDDKDRYSLYAEWKKGDAFGEW